MSEVNHQKVKQLINDIVNQYYQFWCEYSESGKIVERTHHQMFWYIFNKVHKKLPAERFDITYLLIGDSCLGPNCYGVTFRSRRRKILHYQLLPFDQLKIQEKVTNVVTRWLNWIFTYKRPFYLVWPEREADIPKRVKTWMGTHTYLLWIALEKSCGIKWIKRPPQWRKGERTGLNTLTVFNEFRLFVNHWFLKENDLRFDYPHMFLEISKTRLDEFLELFPRLRFQAPPKVQLSIFEILHSLLCKDISNLCILYLFG